MTRTDLESLLPAHKASLSLTHNAHRNCYETLAAHLEHADDAPEYWVSPEQRELALQRDEIWELRWYPDTPVVFCTMRAADLGALMEWLGRRDRTASVVVAAVQMERRRCSKVALDFNEENYPETNWLDDANAVGFARELIAAEILKTPCPSKPQQPGASE